MFLYKYMPEPYSLLTEGYIRVSQLSCLNDPFEASYCPEGLEELCRELKYDYDVSYSEVLDYLENFKHQVGVLSLSESKDNLLMWAHYANDHNGLIVSFNVFSPFHGVPPSVFNKPIQVQDIGSGCGNSVFDCWPVSVKYRKQPVYKVDFLERDYSSICSEGMDRFVVDAFSQKSDEWIYEKEHRFIFRLAQSDRVIINSPESLNELKYIIDGYCLSEVVAPCFDGDGGVLSCAFYLDRILNEDDRVSVGVALEKQGRCSSNVFLFKVNRHCIDNVILGYRRDEFNFDYNPDWHPYGQFFKVYKANVNLSNYTLSFDEWSMTTDSAILQV